MFTVSDLYLSVPNPDLKFQNATSGSDCMRIQYPRRFWGGIVHPCKNHFTMINYDNMI